MADEVRSVLEQAATGEIVGEPNNARDALGIIRGLARSALEVLPARDARIAAEARAAALDEVADYLLADGGSSDGPGSWSDLAETVRADGFAKAGGKE